MKTISLVLMTMLCAGVALSGDIIIQKVQGDVTVRHGVTEVWMKVAVGDVLRPDDTMKTGRKGAAVVMTDYGKRIALPPEVMVDMSDVRELTQEELMLKLTMERVRASSYEWKSNELHIPNVTTVHGANKAQAPPLSENDLQMGVFQLNGTRVLFSNGFYSTCALKTMDVLHRYPPLGVKFENRLLVAQALENANLRSEALNEYVGLSSSENITPGQKELLQTKIAQLRKQSGQ